MKIRIRKGYDTKFSFVGEDLHFELEKWFPVRLCHAGKDYKIFREEGLVPKQEAGRGEEAIRKWLKKEVLPKIKQKEKRYLESENRLKSNVTEFRLTCREVLLVGNFHWSKEKEWWIVEIREPFYREVDFCWGGHATPFGADAYDLMDESGKLSERARSQTQRMLVNLYREFRDRDKIQLLKKLNSRGKL